MACGVVKGSEGGAHHDSSIFSTGPLVNPDVAKPPWIDSIANGKPYVLQQDSASSNKALIIMSHQTYDHLLTHQTLILSDYYVWGGEERGCAGSY
ncbi:hypothetical protein ACTXT7_002176 [Hymenolepis weldensis]